MTRINSTFKDRRIRAENITVGDTIRWTEKNGDIQVSKVGVIARIDYWLGSKYFYTEGGALMGSYDMSKPSKAVITLLKPAPQNQEQELESFQKLLDIAARVVVE